MENPTMTANEFYKTLLADFGFKATEQQEIALQQLAAFLVSDAKDGLFVLKGYAGTGKTSIIGTLAKNMGRIKKKSVLAAPTGRAAKVMANYTGRSAYTIHKQIYYPKKSGAKIQFTLKSNKYKNTVFIIDEASMIGDGFGSGKSKNSLLDDLVAYVYSGDNCQLILIGDTAQLPPVKMEMSPALDVDQLELAYQKSVAQIELTQVVRQAEESGILANATALRENIREGLYDTFKFDNTIGKDLVRLIDGDEIMDAINDAYDSLGHEETALIVRSNKRANLYNEQIRTRILFREDEIGAGDFLMVVKNNYFWVTPQSEAGFIANGDIVELLEIYHIKELYGFRFAKVKVQMVDYPKMKPFDTVIMLDTLTVNAPSLSYEESNRLYQEVMKDYAEIRSKYKRFLEVKSNPYFNALQVKFSYAMTCHKSQGGQWHTVFVEQPWLPEGVNKEYLRWLYTACTRARERLYLIGFKNEFFVENGQV